MNPIVTMTAWATRLAGGGTEASVKITVADSGRLCSSIKKVKLPLDPDPAHPYAWTQEALCALIDGLDCGCDVEIIHDTACKEGR